MCGFPLRCDVAATRIVANFPRGNRSASHHFSLGGVANETGPPRRGKDCTPHPIARRAIGPQNRCAVVNCGPTTTSATLLPQERQLHRTTHCARFARLSQIKVQKFVRVDESTAPEVGAGRGSRSWRCSRNRPEAQRVGERQPTRIPLSARNSRARPSRRSAQKAYHGSARRSRWTGSRNRWNAPLPSIARCSRSRNDSGCRSAKAAMSREPSGEQLHRHRQPGSRRPPMVGTRVAAPSGFSRSDAESEGRCSG